MSELIIPPAWIKRGLCGQVDPDAMHPEREQGHAAETAKSICNGREGDATHRRRAPCPVRELCLQWALDNDERYGVYGGLTAREREKLRGAAA